MKLMVIGFPKSGTTSITEAMNASGLRAAHWQDDQSRYVGALIYDAVFKGLDPFAHLSGYEAVTQADVCLPAIGINYWPNLDFAILRAIRRAHPDCLFVLNYRRPEAICESIVNWPGMQKRFVVSNIPGLPRGIGGKREHLRTWIENHFDACRTYFANDERFIEIDIEREDAPERLGNALGLPVVGWGDHKPEKPPIPLPAT
jgi:hypothetical protein